MVLTNRNITLVTRFNLSIIGDIIKIGIPFYSLILSDYAKD